MDFDFGSHLYAEIVALGLAALILGLLLGGSL